MKQNVDVQLRLPHWDRCFFPWGNWNTSAQRALGIFSIACHSNPQSTFQNPSDSHPPPQNRLRRTTWSTLLSLLHSFQYFEDERPEKGYHWNFKKAQKLFFDRLAVTWIKLLNRMCTTLIKFLLDNSLEAFCTILKFRNWVGGFIHRDNTKQIKIK